MYKRERWLLYMTQRQAQDGGAVTYQMHKFMDATTLHKSFPEPRPVVLR